MNTKEDEEMRENSEPDLSKVPKNLQPHVFKKGQIANPLGRKKGSVSLKQYAKQMLESMTYEERMEYLEGLPKDFIWRMAEGNPETTSEVKATVEVNSISTEEKTALLSLLNDKAGTS